MIFLKLLLRRRWNQSASQSLCLNDDEYFGGAISQSLAIARVCGDLGWGWGGGGLVGARVRKWLDARALHMHRWGRRRGINNPSLTLN